MPKLLNLRLVLTAVACLSLALGARADGLALPAPGRIELLDLDQIRVTRSVELKGRAAPLLAGHPSGTVLASLQGEQLIFWNLPGFTEASSATDPLFGQVIATAFTPTGDRLFMLSRSLKSVLSFSLSSLSVEGIYPLPGGEPIGMEMVADALLVRHKDGVTVLEPSSGALLAQYRLGAPVSGLLYTSKSLTVALEGRSGLLRFANATAEPLPAPAGAGSYGELAFAPGDGFLAVGLSGQTLESWTGSGKLAWTAPLSSGPHSLVWTKDKKLVLALGQSSKMVSVIEAGSGKELGKLPVDNLAGGGVLFAE